MVIPFTSMEERCRPAHRLQAAYGGKLTRSEVEGSCLDQMEIKCAVTQQQRRGWHEVAEPGCSMRHTRTPAAESGSLPVRCSSTRCLPGRWPRIADNESSALLACSCWPAKALQQHQHRGSFAVHFRRAASASPRAYLLQRTVRSKALSSLQRHRRQTVGQRPSRIGAVCA